MPKSTDIYRNVVLPLAAVAETVLTKGKSPGTTALTQQQIFEQADAKRAQEIEAAKKRAMEEELYGMQKQKLQSDIAKGERERKKLEMLTNMFAGGEQGEAAGEPSKTAIDSYRKYQQLYDPSGYVEGLQDEREQTRRIAFDLRKEFDSQSKDYYKVRDSYVRVEESAKDPSAAGDLALIFNYMKILDPGSTVREGEFATAQNAAGIPERIRAKYNQIISGERLSNDTRADFVDRSRRLFKGQQGVHSRQIKRYKDIAGRYGVPFQTVVSPVTVFASVEDANKANLPPGTEVYVAGRKAIVE